MFANEKKVMENSYNTESLSNCDLTLTMVPDGVESRATARLTEFLNRKNVTAGVKPVWRYFGTLPGVLQVRSTLHMLRVEGRGDSNIVMNGVGT